jgi:AraC-like DNA-binding protein
MESLVFLFSSAIVIYIIFVVLVSLFHFFKSIGYLYPVEKVESLILDCRKSPEHEALKSEIINLIDKKVRLQFLDPSITMPARKTAFIEIIEELNISENKYKEVMRDSESYYELYRTVTFKYAAKALKSYKVNVVSLMAGYGGTSGPRNFSDAFKKIYKVTPSQLKRDPKVITV